MGRGQIITTVAGNGTLAYCGDGSPATDACLNQPRHVIVDRKGNVYFTDTYNGSVRKIDTSGIISTVAGTGVQGFAGDGASALGAQLFSPYGLAIDKIGNLYIADEVNVRFRKVDTFGIITTIAGTGVVGYNGDGIAATAAQLYAINNVAVDTMGNAYIADVGNSRIRKITTSGIISTIAGNGTLGYSPDGTIATSAMICPVSLAIDMFQTIYFTDSGCQVRKINSSGYISTIAGLRGAWSFGGDFGPATAAHFSGIDGIAIDDTGNIYLADVSNYRIRKINTLGFVYTIVGIGTAGFSGDFGDPLLAKLFTPFGVGVNNSGRVYIADQLNTRIRCIGCHTRLDVEGVNENMANSFFINPNPINKDRAALYFSSPETEIVTVSLTNVLGVRLLQLSLKTNTVTDVELNFPAGMYFVTCTSQNANIAQKIVIQ